MAEWLAGIAVLLLLGIVWISWSVHILLEIRDTNGKVTVEFGIGRQMIWKKRWQGDWAEVLLKKVCTDSANHTDKPKRKRGRRKRTPSELMIFWRRVVRCRRLDWHMRVGTGEAAQTALAVGAVQALQGICYMIVSATQCHSRMICMPDFGEMTITGKLDCIIMFRLGKVIKEVAVGYIKRNRRE